MENSCHSAKFAAVGRFRRSCGPSIASEHWLLWAKRASSAPALTASILAEAPFCGGYGCAPPVYPDHRINWLNECSERPGGQQRLTTFELLLAAIRDVNGYLGIQ